MLEVGVGGVIMAISVKKSVVKSIKTRLCPGPSSSSHLFPDLKNNNPNEIKLIVAFQTQFKPDYGTVRFVRYWFTLCNIEVVSGWVRQKVGDYIFWHRRPIS